MNSFILALDQGTTGTTAALIDALNYTLVDKINHEFPQIFPTPGQVEHDLNDIWSSVEKAVTELLKKNKVDGSQINCIGITNQRETTCAFDKKGHPLANAIVWQDRRTQDFCQSLKSQESQIRKKTGLPIDPYFSGTKMRWLLNNNQKVQTAATENDLRLGTIDTFLLYKLTSGTSFKTEPSNASRTLLMDLETFQWDQQLLQTFGMQKHFLPEINDSFSLFGKTKNLNFLPDGIPITGILGDQQAALFGQGALAPGEMKCTYGTGAFMLINLGEKLRSSEHGLLSTAYYAHQGKKHYALEGSCYIAGAAVQWLRDNIKIVESSSESEQLASQVENLAEMEHLLFLPFFSGIASPYWVSDAKAAIIGMTRDTSGKHLTRACLDGVALSINDLISSMKQDTGLEIKSLNVDGGMCANNLFCQIQANFSKINIVRPKIIETTAYGAALAAAIGNGNLKISKVKDFWKKDKEFTPENSDVDYYNKKINQWEKTIKQLYFAK